MKGIHLHISLQRKLLDQDKLKLWTNWMKLTVRIMDYVEQDFECEYVGWILKYINNDKYIDVCE